MKYIEIGQKILDKILKIPSQCFVCINLGNYYIKGLIVEDNKIKDYFIKENKNLPEVLRDVWKEKNISTNRVKISVKSPASLVRYFPFPKMDKKKFRQVLFYELNKYIPFSPEEVCFDFSVLREIGPQEVFLLLAVAKKEFIDKLIDLFSKESLKITDISLDSICLTNLFRQSHAENEKINACILDIGYSFSTLTIFNKGIPSLTRDLEFCTKNIFETVAHVKNIALGDIEKWLFSLTDQGQFLELTKSSFSSLCKEIKSSFDYFEVNKGERMEKVYITGGIASVKEMVSFLKENLEIEVAVLDDIDKLNLPFFDDKFNLYRNSFAPALGLSL